METRTASRPVLPASLRPRHTTTTTRPRHSLPRAARRPPPDAQRKEWRGKRLSTTLTARAGYLCSAGLEILGFRRAFYSGRRKARMLAKRSCGPARWCVLVLLSLPAAAARARLGCLPCRAVPCRARARERDVCAKRCRVRSTRARPTAACNRRANNAAGEKVGKASSVRAWRWGNGVWLA